MLDREKMLKQLAGIGIALDMDGYHADAQCVRNALTLLREQEPVEPKVEIDTWVCGNCGATLERQSMVGENVVLAEQFDYCPYCGRKINWNNKENEDGT